jgi:hypothetical protein
VGQHGSEAIRRAALNRTGRILRDFTGGSPPALAEGDEKVQTATAAFAG